MSRTAVVLGASGLVGSDCLRLLLADESYERVHALVRRPLTIEHPKLSQHQVRFDQLDAPAPYWSADAVFCALGTTIKKAGSQEAFRVVDHDYPLAAGCSAATAGAGVFLLISSLGAGEHSRNFYLRVKGETERDLSMAGLRSLVILRPSLILGERAEHRPGESLAAIMMKPLSPLFRGPLLRYRPIPSEVIARTMVHMSGRAERGMVILESEHIAEIGKA